MTRIPNPSDRSRSGAESVAGRNPLEVTIRLHPAFIFAGALAILLFWGETGCLAAAGLTLSMAAHVVGEAISLCSLDLVFEGVSLLPTGAIPYPALPRGLRSELTAAGGGLLANMLLSAVCLVSGSVAQGLAAPAWGGRFTSVAGTVAVGLLLHLTPVLPFTGGRLLRAALAVRMSYQRATRALALTTFAAAVALTVAGLNGYPLLLVAACYLLYAAITESRSVVTQPDWQQLSVTANGLEQLETLSRGQSARTALRALMASRRLSLPVTEDNRLVGVVAFLPLLRTIAERGADCYIGEVMLPAPSALRTDATLSAALVRLEEERAPMLPLENEDGLCGYVTRERLLALAEHPPVNRAGAADQ